MASQTFPNLARYRRSLIVALAALFPVLVFPAAPGSLDAEVFRSNTGSNWSAVGGSLGNARYSKLAQINTTNVRHLGAAWVSERFHEGSTSTVTPVVANGVMYITAGRRVYALNARTGRALWNYKSVSDAPPTPESETMLINAAPNNKGVAIGQGLVFVGLMNGSAIALNQQSGELVWSAQAGVEEENALQAASAPPRHIVLASSSSGSPAVT